MRLIHITLATIAGLSVAAPASAQTANERPKYASMALTEGHHDPAYSEHLQLEIDAGINQGTISKRESKSLREDLDRLVRLERKFSTNGMSSKEHAQLKQHSNMVSQEIRRASHSSNWGGREVNAPPSSADNYLRDYRFAAPFPGDRYEGDIRVGQRISSRVEELPARYKNEYLDNERVYYGYDKGRIYQIDRRLQMVVALLDKMPSQQ